MMRFIMPIILIGISVAVFMVFTNPIYTDISSLRVESTAYNEALGNSKTLENERDKLTAKYNAINPNNLAKLQKLLPENIDNIRLILEIEQIALPYGMVLRDVKYNTTAEAAAIPTPGTVQGGGVAAQVNKDYGVWDLGFSTVGTYNNFLNFTKDLENNLRIVDVSSIAFSSNIANAQSATAPETYKYDFRIKTYWLKN